MPDPKSAAAISKQLRALTRTHPTEALLLHFALWIPFQWRVDWDKFGLGKGTLTGERCLDYLADRFRWDQVIAMLQPPACPEHAWQLVDLLAGPNRESGWAPPARLRKALASYMVLTPRQACEIVLNTDTGDPASLLALMGWHCDANKTGFSCRPPHVHEPLSVSRRSIVPLRRAVDAVQRVARVAAGRSTKGSHAAYEEVSRGDLRAFETLAAMGGVSPPQGAKPRAEFTIKQDAIRLYIGGFKVTSTPAADGVLLPADYDHGMDRPRSLFASNHTVCEAARYLQDYLRGLTQDRVGRCPKSSCRKFWAQGKREGGVGQYCPEHRDRNLRREVERKTRLDATGSYIIHRRHSVYLQSADGQSLPKEKTVTVTPHETFQTDSGETLRVDKRIPRK